LHGVWLGDALKMLRWGASEPTWQEVLMQAEVSWRGISERHSTRFHRRIVRTSWSHGKAQSTM